MFKSRLINFCLAFSYGECLGKGGRTTFNEEANFLVLQLNNLPWFFKYPFYCLIVLFDVILSENLIPFHGLDHPTRVKKIAILKKSNFLMARDFYHFFSSLTILSFYSNEALHENH